MNIIVIESPKLCLYCDSPLRDDARGEHVVPKAIGGQFYLSDFPHKLHSKGNLCRRNVCEACNTTVLSRIDTELTSKSVLSAVAESVLGKRVRTGLDVDGKLYLETNPTSGALHPQMIFDSANPQIRADVEEVCQFGGFEKFVKLFVRLIREAFHEYKSRRGKLDCRRKRLRNCEDRRYPPRILTRQPVNKLKSGMTYELRYLNADDKNRALSTLDNWNDNAVRFSQPEFRLGSGSQTISISFDEVAVVRALMKIGLNLVHPGSAY